MKALNNKIKKKRINVFETTDGEIFDNEKEALDYQNSLNVLEQRQTFTKRISKSLWLALNFPENMYNYFHRCDPWNEVEKEHTRTKEQELMIIELSELLAPIKKAAQDINHNNFNFLEMVMFIEHILEGDTKRFQKAITFINDSMNGTLKKQKHGLGWLFKKPKKTKK